MIWGDIKDLEDIKDLGRYQGFGKISRIWEDIQGFRKKSRI